jgi:hypothetical protein
MRSRGVQSPVRFKPTKANSTGDHFHTNFADEQFLATTCGFLGATRDFPKGTGYLDERLLPGSHVLRHKLPKVKLQRSASSPARHDDHIQFLSDMKAMEGVMGAKGVRLITNMRARAAEEKIDAAFAQGDMKALRAAARGGLWGSRLHKDLTVQYVNRLIAKYDKCLIECRDGLAAHDMVRVQLGMDHVGDLSAEGLGPRLMDHPILVEARSELDKWAPYRPYLHKLGIMLQAGPRPYAQYWLVAVEGNLLSAELEFQATADLINFGQAGVDALEEVLALPEIRYHFKLPWNEKNPLPQQVRSRLAFYGVEVNSLKMRTARDRDDEGSEEAEATSLVVKLTGPDEILSHLEEISANKPDEPLAAGCPAELDIPQRREKRAAAHRRRLLNVRSELQRRANEAVLAQQTQQELAGGCMFERTLKPGETAARPKMAATTGNMARRKRFKDQPPSKGPYYGANMFTKNAFGETV